MGIPAPVLALDYGSKRIGLAVSDAAGEFAFPAGALERKGAKQDLAALAQLIAERGVRQVVVGLPIHMDGRQGTEAAAARAFAEAVERETGLPVDLLDERWTSLEAERALRETKGRRRQRGDVDAAAAALLLRTWLERARRAGGAPA